MLRNSAVAEAVFLTRAIRMSTLPSSVGSLPNMASDFEAACRTAKRVE